MSGLVLLCLPIVVSCVVSLAFRGMGKSFCSGGWWHTDVYSDWGGVFRRLECIPDFRELLAQFEFRGVLGLLYATSIDFWQ